MPLAAKYTCYKRERSYLSREYRGNSIPPCACSAKILGLGEGVLVLDLEGCPRVSGQESDSRKFPEIAHRHSEHRHSSFKGKAFDAVRASLLPGCTLVDVLSVLGKHFGNPKVVV